MTDLDQKQLGKTLWNIADTLRGAMNADDFRDYMLSFLFLRYLSDNYEAAAKKELGADCPAAEGREPSGTGEVSHASPDGLRRAAKTGDDRRTPLSVWYADNPDDVAAFEKQMRRKVHYVVKPDYLRGSIVHLAKTQDGKLLDTLTNDWDFLRETNPAKKPAFDAVVANPPFSYRWEPGEAMGEDMRFKAHGVAPKSAADFAFLLHGLHYLKDDGVMAIILPHGVLFRGGVENRIRTKLLKDGHIDTVIGLPANLFYSTGIPVCILVLKKCKKPDDVLFINAAEQFVKGKRQNQLTDEHIARIIETYQKRPAKPIERYARRVGMKEIEANDFNLNISRYVSTAEAEEEIDLASTHAELVAIDKSIQKATAKHNQFLKELGLPPLP